MTSARFAPKLRSKKAVPPEPIDPKTEHQRRDIHNGDVGRDLLRDHVTRAHWTRYHVKVKILNVF